MSINDSMFERTKFEWGDAAGDGKGDHARIHVLKCEDTARILFSWLSGSQSEVRLQKALPISRGGTGGVTAQSGRLGLGIFVDTNNELVFGAKAVSLYNGTILDHTQEVKPTYNRVAVGHYEIGNVSGFNFSGFKYRLPKDELGNLLCGCAITFEGTVATVKVYKIKYVSGKATLDLTVPMDIPTDRCIDISAK